MTHSDHEMDEEDWDSIEYTLMEHLPSEDRSTCGFQPGNDVIGRGSRDGGIWVNCRNQSMLDYIKRVAEHAERPEGRESILHSGISA